MWCVLEVCEEQRSEEEVLVLAVGYVDRYLSVAPATPKSSLQLLGSACLLIASKLRDATPFTAAKLVDYTDHSVTAKQLTVRQAIFKENFTGGKIPQIELVPPA